ncbi:MULTISPECIES: hypothetical protein [Dickeya]|uniref:Uncharacterized protein n=1 Tax=Dickeya aquatica TaxID=1401087 RepID=A0A375AC57_9GAMM|nr:MULTISPECIES: hypothetical protein [Dickeya]SLM63506.1 hypothetical protein DAQ1742_02633 [Dickeya aquatica]
MLTTKMKALLLCGGLAAAFGAGWYVQGVRWDADISARETAAAQEASTGQQAVIATQALTFHRFNEIARQANQYAINIKAKSDEKQIIYRTIVKRDPASRQCVSDDVANRLLDYAHSLRASTMHTTASGVDPAGTGAAASACRLTYGQVIYWVDSLLAVIEQANGQLAGIRKTE